MFKALLFVVLLFGSVHGKLPPFWPDIVVTMTNSLGGPVLIVDCKSKGHDLGPQNVPFNQNYQFKFQPNFWGTTRYSCTFQWGKQFKQFDIFYAPRDQGTCHYKCNWAIKPNGPCRIGDGDKCFPWK